MLSENGQLNSPTVCQHVNVNAILIIYNEELNSATECQHVDANAFETLTMSNSTHKLSSCNYVMQSCCVI